MPVARMQKVAMYPGVFQMERTMKCSVQVVTAGVLVGQDQSLVWVRQEDGHRVPLEVSFVLAYYVYTLALRLFLTCYIHYDMSL